MRMIFAGLMMSLAFEFAFGQIIDIESLPALQQPVSNNAVTLVSTEEGVYLYSFLGLGSGKTWRDTSSAASVLNPGAKTWTQLSAVPGGSGRLAASAISAGGAAWLFGGYTVAADGSEKSIPGVYRIRPGETGLQWVTDMPIPVEDSVLLVYENRYIYLVSGWHDLGNVNLVQRYDTVSDTWTQATPIPGTPLFGHAGGIVSNNIVYCDGVAVIPHADRSRSFAASDECWLGLINGKDSRRIDWRPIQNHPGLPRYRMAAAGLPSLNGVLFVGGSENPYNFDGMGYDGDPSEPAKHGLLFNLETFTWQVLRQVNAASMDHRGLVSFGGSWVVIGGMLAKQAVTDTVTQYLLR